ncbi:MAG: hypothetical protein JO266_05265 [Acidobacteria bacterium]|nr:hypothetical protein [Acidobacteriota bacterium]
MREFTLTERLLALITRPERAAAITGDLLEESRTQNAFWFWFQLIRTALSLSGQAILTAPLLMPTLIIASISLMIVGIPFTASWFRHMISSPGIIAFTGWHPQFIYWSKWAVVFLWGHLLYPLVIGSAVSKLSQGTECVLCGAVAMLMESIVVSVYLEKAATAHSHVPISFLALNSLPAIVFAIAGISVRLRAIQRASRY